VPAQRLVQAAPHRMMKRDDRVDRHRSRRRWLSFPMTLRECLPWHAQIIWPTSTTSQSLLYESTSGCQRGRRLSMKKRVRRS
jgi:hypothetical protein